MFFFIAGNTNKLVKEETVKINKNGFLVDAIVKIYKDYITLFFIPIIPIGKKYSFYIPHTDEYFETNFGSKMPKEYYEICKKIGQNY